MLYMVSYWVWKVGDLVSVSYSLGVTQKHNLELFKERNISINVQLFEYKFEDMAKGFGIFTAISSITFVISLFAGWLQINAI